MRTALDFPIYVECPECGSRFDESEVELTNIESDIWERDVVTFECPQCGKEVESLRFG